MNQSELNAILADHKKWLNGSGGKQADLRGQDLRGLDFAHANLTWADLAWANIIGANLTEAYLTLANLAGANLARADLTGANLTGANLNSTNLRGANLTDATYDLHSILQISFDDLDLIAEAMRHDAANHPDPSAFDRWANGGPCPYENKKAHRLICGFKPEQELWTSANPIMSLHQLWLKIAKSLDIKI